MTSLRAAERTVVSVLTPPGRGAVAVVAVAGRDAVSAVNKVFHAKNGRSLDAQPLGRIVYGHWASAEGEDLIVCRQAEEVVEIHCHGGRQSVAGVINRLVAIGCEEIPWKAWVAQQNNCPLHAEVQVALAEASSTRTALILLDQFHGALRHEVETIREMLQVGDFSAAGAHLQLLVARISCGLHLTEPWRVVIAGRPNVGKSSLINALVGYQRAIVFDQPGTTRDVVSTKTVIDGWPVQLSDTAGLHTTSDTLEAAGIELTRAQLAWADLVIWVEEAPASNRRSTPREILTRRVAELSLELPTRQLFVLNKIDLVESPRPATRLPTSTITGQGIPHLLTAISEQLVPEPPPAGAAVPFTPRQAKLLQAAAAAVKRRDAVGACVAFEDILAS